jgi:hypothetical protein
MTLLMVESMNALPLDLWQDIILVFPHDPRQPIGTKKGDESVRVRKHYASYKKE